MKRHRPRLVAPLEFAGPSLAGRALEDLSFIRATMARAATFDVLPGWGGVAMGATAIGAAALASQASSPKRWLAVWLAAAAIASMMGLVDIALQARRAGEPLYSAASSRFACALIPGFVAGAVMTAALWRSGEVALLPGTWLLAYGVAIVCAGAASVRDLRIAGMAFMTLGTIALLVPAVPGDLALALGFGGIHAFIGLRSALSHHG